MMHCITIDTATERPIQREVMHCKHDTAGLLLEDEIQQTATQAEVEIKHSSIPVEATC